MAQVDHQRGQQHHRHPGPTAEQRQGNKLRRAGKHQQRHANRLGRRQPGRRRQGAVDDAKRHGANQQRQHIAHGLKEFT